MSTISSFAILPYLKTSAPVTYKDLVFRNIEDISDLTGEAVNHLKILSRLFFLRDNLLIKQISYAALQLPNENKQYERVLFEQLREFRIIVAYLYSAPHLVFGDTFLTNEHASLYFCVPKRVPLFLINEVPSTERVGIEGYPDPDSLGEVDGYEVTLDFHSENWVTKGSRIYPPAEHMWLNLSQDLHRDLDHHFHNSYEAQLILFISSKPERSHLSDRILTSLNWYNRSTSKNIEEDVALVYLAIAFECLLNLKQGEKVTARFREAVSLLLGGIPRLESWLTQFYNARSQIVHEGWATNLMFLATDNLKKNPSDHTITYRSLVSVGRQIFQLCLSAITNGALMVVKLKLTSMFFTNQQRLEKICEILTKDNGTAIKKIQAISQYIRDIENYKFVREEGLQLKTLIATTKLLIKTYLETEPKIESDFLRLLNDFTKTNKDNNYQDALSKLREIQEYRKTLSKVDKRIISTEVLLLLDCVWHYTFLNYFLLKEIKEIEDNASDSSSGD